MKNKNSKSSGFTLLEILLVVGIIAILAGIVIVAINPSKQLATVRNAQRKSDIKQIESALQQYYIDNFKYPTTTPSVLTEICNSGNATYPQTDLCTGFFDLSVLVPEYITSIPTDPRATTTENGSGYYFKQDSGTRKIGVKAELAELEQSIVVGMAASSTVVVEEVAEVGSITFDGVGNYLTFSDTSMPTGNDTWSLSVYTKRTVLGQDGTWPGLFDYGTADTAS